MSFSGKNPEITHCFAYMDSQHTKRASARNGGILVRVLLYSGKQFEATAKYVTKFAAMFVRMILLSVEYFGVMRSLHEGHYTNIPVTIFQSEKQPCWVVPQVCHHKN